MTETRTKVTDATARLLTPSTKVGEVVPVAPTEPPPVRQLFTRVVQGTGEETEDPVREHLQTLINKCSHDLCVCSPNRSDMMAARAEMHAHPGYAEYKARRDAAMAAH